MSDPFFARWDIAPDGMNWHAHDANGQGVYFADKPIPVDDSWWITPQDGVTGDGWQYFTDYREMAGLDWRDSLRHRPEEANS